MIKGHSKRCEPMWSCAVRVPKVRIVLPFAAARTGNPLLERVSELEDGRTLTWACIGKETTSGNLIPHKEGTINCAGRQRRY